MSLRADIRSGERDNNGATTPPNRKNSSQGPRAYGKSLFCKTHYFLLKSQLIILSIVNISEVTPTHRAYAQHPGDFEQISKKLFYLKKERMLSGSGTDFPRV